MGKRQIFLKLYIFDKTTGVYHLGAAIAVNILVFILIVAHVVKVTSISICGINKRRLRNARISQLRSKWM
jgi:hypothetical protein